MDIQDLKDKIKIDNKIRHILQSLNMKYIKEHDEYYSCCMPDGDNKTSTIVYKNTLIVKAHTRDIVDKHGCSDIISLVSFINKSFLSNSIKWICDVCEYDYYGRNEEVPKSLKWMKEILKLNNNYDNEEDEYCKIKPITEKILTYYKKIQNIDFEEDNISLETQRLFEIGYDLETHRITIPIRDEIGTLVGVKGRLFGKDNHLSDMKYIYLCKCPKSKLLFGLDKTYKYILKNKLVYVFESEKAVMQMWSYGIKNCVSIGGHEISKRQSNILTRMGVNIIFCYDKEIGIIKKDKKIYLDKQFWIHQTRHLINGQKYGILYDRYDILDEKQSPSDNVDKFKELQKNIIYKTCKGGNSEI